MDGDGIGLDDERPNEKVALPQARLTSCEVIGTPRGALQFPRHLNDSSIAPPLPTFSRGQSDGETHKPLLCSPLKAIVTGRAGVRRAGRAGIVCRVLKPQRVPLPSLSVGG